MSQFHRDFASLGFSVSKNTLHEYLGYPEDSFLLFLLPKHERSLRKQAHNPKKLHVIDPGLMAAFQGNPDRDVGRKLETTVFLHARRRHRALYDYANGGEADLCDEEGASFWNTCRSLTDPDTAGRERRPLSLGKSRAAQAKGVLLYHEFDSALASALPEAQPAWRWLLEQRT